jgi:hypothetical protein
MRRFTIAAARIGAISYQNVGADRPLEALKALHAEALASKAVLLEGDRLLFPILPIGTLQGRFGWRPPCQPQVPISP